MAEGEGFEPPFPGRKAVFKTAALNHSAIPPSPLFLPFPAFSVNHKVVYTSKIFITERTLYLLDYNGRSA
jgi:hypothetical protein